MKLTPRSFRSLPATFTLMLASVACVACSDDGETGLTEQDKQDVLANYAKNVEATYADTLNGAIDLHSAVHELSEAPSEEELNHARDVWLASRDPYGESEAFRFYDGPIDDPETGPEGLINAWPMYTGMR